MERNDLWPVIFFYILDKAHASVFRLRTLSLLLSMYNFDNDFFFTGIYISIKPHLQRA